MKGQILRCRKGKISLFGNSPRAGSSGGTYFLGLQLARSSPLLCGSGHSPLGHEGGSPVYMPQFYLGILWECSCMSDCLLPKFYRRFPVDWSSSALQHRVLVAGYRVPLWGQRWPAPRARKLTAKSTSISICELISRRVPEIRQQFILSRK
jgi:hypothetical protein